MRLLVHIILALFCLGIVISVLGFAFLGFVHWLLNGEEISGEYLDEVDSATERHPAGKLVRP